MPRARYHRWTEAEDAELARRKANGETAREIAAAMGKTNSQVCNRCDEIGALRYSAPAEPRPLDTVVADIARTGSTLHVTDGDKSASLTMTTRRPVKTLEDLVRVCEIDVAVWEVVEWTANTWETASKQADNTMRPQTLYQIKARLKRLAYSPVSVEHGIIAALRSRIKPLRAVKRPAREESGYLFVATFGEPHLGKMAWQPETGEHYDLRIGVSRLRESHRHLMQRARALKPDRIALILGDDYFTADNPQNTTTAGTPQEVDGRYKKVFRTGVSLAREIIEGWRQIAPVSVWIKPGNHDQTITWHAGLLLDAIYEGTSDIEVVNPDRLRHYQQWGCCLIGLTHGDKETHAKLPMLMASEAKEMWAVTTCRVWLLAHLHTLKAKSARSVIQPIATDVNEEFGVTMRWCRSLSGTDGWHFGLGYVQNLKGAEGFVFHRELGETDIHTSIVRAA